MARSPTPPKAIPQVMWGVWLMLNVGVATALFAWPTAAPAVNDAFKPENLWVATWPVIVGAIVAIAAARIGTAPSMAAGDVLGLYQAGLRAIYVWMRTLHSRVANAEKRLSADWENLRPVASISRAVAQWELYLRVDWLLVGGALLALTAVLLTIIAA